MSFVVGDRVRFIATTHLVEIGRLGTVIVGPLSALGSMRVHFDGDLGPSLVWPDQFERVSIVDLVAELDEA